MKKIFILFSSLFILLSFHPQVSAQTPACPVIPTLGIPMPGLETCGNANDLCNNKCCVNKDQIKKQSLYDIPILGGILKQTGFTTEVFDNFITTTSEVVVTPCSNGSPSTPGDINNPGCICMRPTSAPLAVLNKMCANIKDGGEKGNCISCLGGTGQEVGVWTSVGCVRSNLSSFIQETLLGWGIGLAGGVSILCIMYAAFMMQTSGGNAEKIKKAQQLMTSCITGLMVIIFSVFILQLIGVKILRIPGFN